VTDVAGAVTGGADRLAAAINVIPQHLPPRGVIPVSLETAGRTATADECLWAGIRTSTEALGFAQYSRFLDQVLCATLRQSTTGGSTISGSPAHVLADMRDRVFDGVAGTSAYQLVKAATELFLMLRCRTLEQAVDDCGGAPGVAGAGPVSGSGAGRAERRRATTSSNCATWPGCAGCRTCR
jgi:hypothetical protein